jgi:hypothetical protein
VEELSEGRGEAAVKVLGAGLRGRQVVMKGFVLKLYLNHILFQKQPLRCSLLQYLYSFTWTLVDDRCTAGTKDMIRS